MEPVDISGWQRDEEFFPFPEGARDKYALIAPDSPSDIRIVGRHRYLMKFSNPRYNIQFWSEIIAKIVGDEMGVDVPSCFYAEDTETGQPGSLISWFYGEGVESGIDDSHIVGVHGDEEDGITPPDLPSSHSLYVPGSSYMVRQIENYDLKTGKQHNLKHISYLITNFRRSFKIDFWPHWARIIVFDAIIGNTDRHQDNWGVLWRTSATGVRYPRFAPAFDNGTSLLHEIMEERVSRLHDDDFAYRYIARGRHHLRREISDERQAQHIDLVKQLIDQRGELRSVIGACVSFDIGKIESRLIDLTKFKCVHRLTEDRAHAVLKVIANRRQMIADLVENEVVN